MFRCGTGQQVDRDGGLDSSVTGGWRRRDRDFRCSGPGSLSTAQ